MRAVRDADVVLTSSVRLAREFANAGLKHIQLLPSEPDELEDCSSARNTSESSVVDYAGYIGKSFDFRLVAELAQRCPKLCIRLSGPVDPAVSSHVKELANHRNVEIRMLTQTAQAAATVQPGAAIVPLIATSPRTDALPAYLAVEVGTGVPVISTIRLEGGQFSHRVDVCTSPELFIRMVRLRTRRRADSHLWDLASASFRHLVLEP